MDNFKITPLFSMDAKQLQELTAPTGKFTRDSPKGASNAKIVSGENTRRDDRRDGCPEFNQPSVFELLP